MSIYKGTELLAGVSTDTISNANYLLDFKWSDHIINSMEWLRADTFSWQNGDVYKAAYNHLVADWNGGTSTTETVGSYTITYVLATDGHKITTDEATVLNIYNETGVAWYFVLDTTNQRFKLPRTKYGFTGLRDTVGKYVEAGLPNITGNFWSDMTQGMLLNTGNGAFLGYKSPDGPSVVPTVGSNFDANNRWSFDASRSSSIYGNSTTVQPPATQMYLYFYVGQFSQSATEQTAGLNSELFNGKVDLNAQNLSNAGKSLIAGLGMPSSRYIDLTLGASGTQYTAPANGWFLIDKSATDQQYLYIGQPYGPGFTLSASGNQGLCASIPVFKGNVVYIAYNASGTTNRFMFIYAEGDA